MKKLVSLLLALTMFVTFSMPASAYVYEWYDWESWLTYEGGYTTNQKTKYCFLPEQSVLSFAYETEEDYVIKYPKELYAGSDMYVPIGALDPALVEPETYTVDDEDIDDAINNDGIIDANDYNGIGNEVPGVDVDASDVDASDDSSSSSGSSSSSDSGVQVEEVDDEELNGAADGENAADDENAADGDTADENADAADGETDDEDIDYTMFATEQQIKEDSVAISYSILNGPGYVDKVSLVNSKSEELDDLPAGMYAKIELADNYLPLSRSRVQVRLVLSVNGVSYQETAVTFRCYIINRVELIKRNSVFGALKPAQFHSLEYGGTATFDFGNGVRYETKVKPRTRYYLNLDRTPDDDIEALYPEAYIEYYNFLGNNDAFPATGKLEIPIDEDAFKEQKTSPEIYVYVRKNHTLRAVSLSAVEYSHKNRMLTMETDTLQNYVLSSRPLLKEVDNQFDILRSGYAEVEDEENEE